MFKNVSTLEVKGHEKRLYHFYCQPNAPLGEVYEALCSMKLYVFEQMKLQENKQNDSLENKIKEKLEVKDK
jgi:hypothetical protein